MVINQVCLIRLEIVHSHTVQLIPKTFKIFKTYNDYKMRDSVNECFIILLF